MIGGHAAGFRPQWQDKFESPILARLAWWKAQALHREYVEAQQRAHTETMQAQIDQLERNRQEMLKGSIVRLVDPWR